MLTRLLSLSCLALTLALQLPVQTPTVEKKEEPKTEEPRNPNAFYLDEQWQGLLGAWSLIRFDHETEIAESESVRGTLTIQAGFLSLVIHARSQDEDEDQVGQAGIHRWHMTDNDVMQTATMIGHSNMGQDFEWEGPNIPREFRVSLTTNELALTRPDGSVLNFIRLHPSAYPLSASKRIQTLRAGFDD